MISGILKRNTPSEYTRDVFELFNCVFLSTAYEMAIGNEGVGEAFTDCLDVLSHMAMSGISEFQWDDASIAKVNFLFNSCLSLLQNLILFASREEQVYHDISLMSQKLLRCLNLFMMCMRFKFFKKNSHTFFSNPIFIRCLSTWTMDSKSRNLLEKLPNGSPLSKTTFNLMGIDSVCALLFSIGVFDEDGMWLNDEFVSLNRWISRFREPFIACDPAAGTLYCTFMHVLRRSFFTPTFSEAQYIEVKNLWAVLLEKLLCEGEKKLTGRTHTAFILGMIFVIYTELSKVKKNLGWLLLSQCINFLAFTNIFKELFLPCGESCHVAEDRVETNMYEILSQCLLLKIFLAAGEQNLSWSLKFLDRSEVIQGLVNRLLSLTVKPDMPWLSYAAIYTLLGHS
ncbi:hypothetical protein BC829DRAFT_80733 [Chytridium lagenaria]|nr:hypothetical protein BC829DRAFT_80733 [Chytridium lagenaria]